MTSYNHAFDFAFEVVSAHPQGEDVTPVMLRANLMARAKSLSDKELGEACNLFDTFKAEADAQPQELEDPKDYTLICAGGDGAGDLLIYTVQLSGVVTYDAAQAAAVAQRRVEIGEENSEEDIARWMNGFEVRLVLSGDVDPHMDWRT